MTAPEKATIADLFRLMTEMRTEHGGKLEALSADMTSVKKDLASVKGTVEAHTGELEAIRNVVDNDLAGQGQVMTLEGKMTDVQRTTRQNGKKIDKLSERMDRAGIPAE